MSNNRITDIEQCSTYFKALSNPNRLRIFLRLVSCCAPGTVYDLEGAKACVGDLGADLGLAPSTVSHHIKELHRADLIRMERRGQRIECWAPREVLEKISSFFTGCCTGLVDQSLLTVGDELPFSPDAPRGR